MKNGGLCHCGQRLNIFTSRTQSNPGRDFWRCRNWNTPNDCGLFLWDDDDVREMQKKVKVQEYEMEALKKEVEDMKIEVEDRKNEVDYLKKVVEDSKNEVELMKMKVEDMKMEVEATKKTKKRVICGCVCLWVVMLGFFLANNA